MFSSDYAVSNDMYRLRCDAAKQAVDITNAFQNFRNDEELLDITLVCLSSNGRSVTVKAHQLILAAYSPVFKDMFNFMEEKKDPIIFMKGISHDNLSAILDFMYQGVVDVPKSVMNDFLADAQELQIKGLRGENNDDDYDEDSRNIKTSPKDIKNFQLNNNVKMELEQSKRMNGYISSNLEDDLNQHDSFMESKLLDYDNLTAEGEAAKLRLENERLRAKLKKRLKPKPAKEKPVIDEYQFEVMKQEHQNKYQNNELRYTDPIDSYEKVRVEQLFSKVTDKWVGANSKRRSVYKCNMCEREVRSDRRAKHLRANHPEDI